MSAAETPEAIQHEMRQIRSEVRDDVEGIFDRAEQLADWRYYVRRYPWWCMAAAAAVGYLVVPKHPTVKVDAAALAEALNRNGVTPDSAGPTRRTSWVQTGLGLAGSLLMRQAAGMAGRELSRFLDSRAAASAANHATDPQDEAEG